MKESLVLTLMSFGLVLGNFQDGPEISVTVDGVQRKKLTKFAGYLVKPGQTIALNCSFTCLDDNESKCTPIRWAKLKRNGTLASKPDHVKSDSRTTKTVDGYWLVHSTVQFTSSFTQHVLYQCTTRHGFQATAFIDVIEVESATNVTLPTRLKDESLGKTLYPKLVVNETAVPVQLKCVFTTTAPKIISTVAWRHNGKYLREGEEYDQKLVSEALKHVAFLMIKKPKPDSLGEYECKLSVSVGKQVTDVVEVVGPPMTLLQKDKHSLRVPEDSKLSLVCGYRASPKEKLKIEWFRGNYSIPLILEVGMKIEDQIEEETGKVLGKGNVLSFENIKPTAKGLYFCKVSNRLGHDYLGWQIRVKNRYAFLWPLIGIILEVIVVLVIIVVYEVKRNKKRKAKLLAQQNLQFTDEDCQGMPGDYDADSEVRQRLARA